jgi:hypothetical protein
LSHIYAKRDNAWNKHVEDRTKFRERQSQRLVEEKKAVDHELDEIKSRQDALKERQQLRAARGMPPPALFSSLMFLRFLFALLSCVCFFFFTVVSFSLSHFVASAADEKARETEARLKERRLKKDL